jgi:ABC-type phosphate transport system substrate-binding protein
MKLLSLPAYLLVALLSLSAGQLVHAKIAIVVHPDNSTDSLTQIQAANIFLGKVKTMPNGQLVIPIDQSRKSSVRADFYLKLVNKNPNQLNAYWARQVFTGRSQPPNQVASDAEIKALIGANPGMVGYISSDKVDDSLKVILTID